MPKGCCWLLVDSPVFIYHNISEAYFNPVQSLIDLPHFEDICIDESNWTGSSYLLDCNKCVQLDYLYGLLLSAVHCLFVMCVLYSGCLSQQI